LSNPENIKKLAMFSGNTAFSANILDVETVPYTLRFGECLMDVADRLTGDASRWIEIAQVNNWSSPYTDAQDQVAAAGTPLQIPADMISGINITDNLNLLTNRGEPLLTDLRLTDGDLSLSSGAATVSGIDNFNQAIINRLSTKLGEQIGLPTYGLSDLSGAKQTDTTIAFITDRVITQLLSDPRVYSVRDVSVLLNGDKVDVKLTIFTVDKQATELTIPLN
jgi:hypothetical protein